MNGTSSVDTSIVAQEKSAHAKWVRALRKESPPVNLDEYIQQWQAFFNQYATHLERWHRLNAGYHNRIASLTQLYIPPNARVLDVGSGNGDLLAALEPSFGVGIDIAERMVRLAAEKHPTLEFRQMAAETLQIPGEPFDYIVLSDLVGYLYDIRVVFERLLSVSHPRTRIVIHWYSNLWQPLLAVAEKVGLKYPQPLLNWTTVADIENLLHLAGFEIVHRRPHILWPKRVPVLSTLVNRYLAHTPGFRWMCLTNWI